MSNRNESQSKDFSQARKSSSIFQMRQLGTLLGMKNSAQTTNEPENTGVTIETTVEAILTPEKFSGLDNNVVEFLEKYDLFAKINEWDEEEKFQNFSEYLSDLALNVFDDLDRNEIDNYEKLKERFLIEFDENALKSLAEFKLMTRKLRDNEDSMEYFTDVIRLCKVSDENMDFKTICKFILQGLKPKIYTAMEMCQNDDLNQLKERVLKSKFGRNEQKPDEIVTKSEISPFAGRSIEFIAEKLSEQTQKRAGNVICRNCNKDGHIEKDCGKEFCCINCDQPGHVTRNAGNESCCDCCNRSGHNSPNCAKNSKK